MKKQTKLGLVLAAAAVISVSVASLVSARGWVQQGADWYYVDNNGDYVTGTIQSSGNAKFYLDDETGAMQRDYLLQDYNGNTYYFGSNGAMVTNTWVAVDSSIVDSGADYIPDNFWFYFQASGKAVKGSSGLKKTTIDGKKYAFSEDGTMLTGWISEDGKTVNPDDNTNPFADADYYAGGDNDGVLRSGWVTYYDGYDGDDIDYTNLYFYFNTSNNSKITGTKKINGKTYYFNNEGVMLSGWDASNTDKGGSADNDGTYFSGEDDGHQVKKGWVYAVPTAAIDLQASSDYDDEEKYMYFNASGKIIANQMKKINGKYYVFGVGEGGDTELGIMKTGLVVWAPNNERKFITTFDLDWANGSDLAKKGIIKYGQNSEFKISSKSEAVAAVEDFDINEGDKIVIYNFGDDGARKDGANTVTFADDDYTFVTNAAGNKPSGSSAKKYYSLGIQLKASADIKYGIYSVNNALTAQGGDDAYKNALSSGDYLVLNTSGSKVKGKDQAFKDADGNYWLIDKNSGSLKGIWTVNIKKASSKFTTLSVKNDEDYVDKKKYQISTNSDLADILFAEGEDDTNAQRTDWVAKVKDGYVTFTTEKEISGYWFQSDYGDKTNVWLPFGAYDNTKKTCAMEYDPDGSAYQFTPNDDYFLNCYWTPES